MPTFVRVEYWSASRSDWKTGHYGINLMDPETYVQKLAKRGTVARAVELEGDEVWYADGGDLL